MQAQELGLMHFWQAGDAITHSVAWLLLAMSIVSWYFILSKTWSTWRMRRGAHAALEQFWNARTMDESARHARERRSRARFAPLARKARAAAAMQPDNSLAASIDRDELVTRALRGEITQVSARWRRTRAARVGGQHAPFVGCSAPSGASTTRC